ncbi:MAG: hypothetical protein KC586_26915, partial [Myxococcales bacterium]|nr:hypothetical protein [Myxococcales bacterium]
MAFRDEEGALRARVEDLEQRLEASEREVARLRGEDAEASSSGRVVMERVLPFVLDDAGRVALAEAVHARVGVDVTQVGRVLRVRRVSTADVLELEVEVREEDGRTVVSVSSDARDLKARRWITPGVITAFSALPIFGVLLDLQASGVPLWHAAWALPSVALASGWWTRRRVDAKAEAHTRATRGLFETLVSVAETHAPK